MAQPYLNALGELFTRELRSISGSMCKLLRRSVVHLYGNLRLINTHSVRFKLLDQRCLELIVSDKASPLMHMEKSPIKKGRKAIFTRR